jgi:hypothetical protein
LASRGSWNYGHLVGLYRQAFGGRVILLPYELLRDDPEAFVRELESPFGLEHVAAPGERPNPSLSGEELRWYPKLTALVRTLPIGGRLRRAALKRYMPALMHRRLRPLVRLLQRVKSLDPVTVDVVPDEAVEYFRGQAEILRGEPHYARYAEDYLL